MLPAGSPVNQAIVGPSSSREIPFSSCSKPSYRSNWTPRRVSSSHGPVDVLDREVENRCTSRGVKSGFGYDERVPPAGQVQREEAGVARHLEAERVSVELLRPVEIVDGEAAVGMALREHRLSFRRCLALGPPRRVLEVIARLAESKPRCEHVFVSEATILHADLDAFFASVEQRDDPRLRGRPVIVGGGVVLAASYEAKAFGIRTAMGGRQARRLCPHAVVVPPRMSAYSEASKAVFEVFEDTTPLVEGLSIDEAFLDVAGLATAGRPAGGDRRAAPARGARRGRPPDHRRGRADEVPREGRERGREAGRAAGRPARRRARVPAPASRRAAVGRRPRDLGEAPEPRDHDRRPGRGNRRADPRLDARPRGRPAPARARPQPRPTAGSRRSPPALDRVAARARPLGRGRSRRSTRPSSRSSTASRAACAPAKRVCRTVVLRLRFADFSRATRSHTLPQATARTQPILETARALFATATP